MLLTAPTDCYWQLLLTITDSSYWLLLPAPTDCYCTWWMQLTVPTDCYWQLQPTYWQLLLAYWEHQLTDSSYWLLLTAPTDYYWQLLLTVTDSSKRLLLTAPTDLLRSPIDWQLLLTFTDSFYWLLLTAHTDCYWQLQPTVTDSSYWLTESTNWLTAPTDCYWQFLLTYSYTYTRSLQPHVSRQSCVLPSLLITFDLEQHCEQLRRLAQQQASNGDVSATVVTCCCQTQTFIVSAAKNRCLSRSIGGLSADLFLISVQFTAKKIFICIVVKFN